MLFWDKWMLGSEPEKCLLGSGSSQVTLIASDGWREPTIKCASRVGGLGEFANDGDRVMYRDLEWVTLARACTDCWGLKGASQVW